MKSFTEADMDYLEGSKFSNGRYFNIANSSMKSVSRLSFLKEISTNKNVIHVGFTDHIPLIDYKIKKNLWLHKLLVDTANLCIGIDIDEEAVRLVEEKFNIDNLFAYDITTEEIPSIIKNKKWDYMIIGEVLEHIDNPVHFLEKIREKYQPYVENLIITVPNALNTNNLGLIFKNQELINTDHRFWFTPYTLAKVITRAGYSVDELFMSQTFTPDRLWKRVLAKKYPLCRETVIMTAKFG